MLVKITGRVIALDRKRKTHPLLIISLRQKKNALPYFKGVRLRLSLLGDNGTLPRRCKARKQERIARKQERIARKQERIATNCLSKSKKVKATHFNLDFIQRLCASFFTFSFFSSIPFYLSLNSPLTSRRMPFLES